MAYDLENMDLKDLQDLKQKLERAIASYEDRRRKEAYQAAKEAAEQHGFRLDDLVGVKRPKATIAPKYANPVDPVQTWSGRGRKPAWVQEQLDTGKSLDDLAI